MSKFLMGAALAACVAAVAVASPASAASVSGNHATHATDVSAARHPHVVRHRHHRRPARVVVRPRGQYVYGPGPGYYAQPAYGPHYYSYAPGVGPIPSVGFGPFIGIGPFAFSW
jgi:Ni/Co efflux regulator RcnB